VRLAQKLTVYFLAIGVVPLVIVGAATYRKGRQAMISQTVNHLISVNMLKEAELRRWIEDGKRDLQRLAGDPFFKGRFRDVQSAHDLAEAAHEEVHRHIIADYLAPSMQSRGFVELFILRPRDGMILISTDFAQEGKHRESEPFFLEGRQRTYLQGVSYSQSLEQPVMIMAMPVVDRQGNLVAVLAGRFDLGELTRIMEQGRSLSRTEDTYLVNSFNFFVTEPRFGKDFALRKAVHTEGVEAALGGGEGVGFYLDYRRIPVIGAYKWLPDLQLGLVTEVDQDEAFAPVVRMGWVVAGIAVLVVAGTILSAFFVARTVTRPVQRLAQGAEEIGRGNLEHRVGTEASDEIGGLSRALDRMAADLKTTTVSRDELARERDFSQAVINSLPGVFYLFDGRGRFLRWNKNLERVTGYGAEEISGMTPLDFFSREEARSVAEAIERAFAEGEASVEAAFVTKSGRRVPYYFTGIRVTIDSQPLLTGVGMDITERKRAEGALLATSAELERSNRELERFAYVASHDLQEPLRMVASYTRLLERRYGDKLDQDAREFIGYAVDGANRMQRLIQDLLSYARVTTRGRPFEPVDVQAALEEAILNLQVTVAEAGAEITHDPLPAVRGDRTQIVQLFQNLIDNAVKFRREDRPPRIHVSAHRREAEWLFCVEDNGIGIDPRYFDRIFVLFQRLHGREDYPGTGIGLALCKRIVERHGGSIGVDSRVGEGARFCFTLPHRSPADNPQGAIRQAEAP
jgi:PAS domain S-box-containing protein